MRALHSASWLLVCAWLVAPGAAFAQDADPAASQPVVERLVDVRVHGNHSTPDEQVVALAGLTIGAPLPADAVDGVRRRLRESGRFTSVDVRKRYQSLTDASAVSLVLLVSEPARALDVPMPGVPAVARVISPMQKLRDSVMFLPVLSYADGYGFTYGGRTTFADALGKRGRLSVPLTWGGVRRAALEGEKRFTSGPLSRIEASAAISQRENPHFRLDDRRMELALRAERRLVGGVRVGGGVGWTDVSFGGPPRANGFTPAFDLDDRFVTLGADVTLDTRVDPTFPRNAVFATAGWDALRFDGGRTIGRLRSDVRGYVGLFGQSVLSLRARYLRADAPLPAYEQFLLGGAASLRGYRAGTYAGDTLLATSAELRMPLTSPLKVGKSGVSVFLDSGAAAPHGARLRDQPMRSGAGVGLFFIATVFQLNLDVAKGFDGGTRVHLMTGFSF